MFPHVEWFLLSILFLTQQRGAGPRMGGLSSATVLSCDLGQHRASPDLSFLICQMETQWSHPACSGYDRVERELAIVCESLLPESMIQTRAAVPPGTLVRGWLSVNSDVRSRMAGRSRQKPSLAAQHLIQTHPSW